MKWIESMPILHCRCCQRPSVSHSGTVCFRYSENQGLLRQGRQLKAQLTGNKLQAACPKFNRDQYSLVYPLRGHQLRLHTSISAVSEGSKLQGARQQKEKRGKKEQQQALTATNQSKKVQGQPRTPLLPLSRPHMTPAKRPAQCVEPVPGPPPPESGRPQLLLHIRLCLGGAG